MSSSLTVQLAPNEAAVAAQLARVSTKAASEFPIPESMMTLREFVESFFVPEHVAKKALSGRTHYQAILKHVCTPEEMNRVFQGETAKFKAKLTVVPDWPYLDHLKICECRPDDVQRLISAAQAKGYSSQTVKHIRNVVRSIFTHAKKKAWHTGDNPADLVSLPATIHKNVYTLTLAQARQVLSVLRYPEKEMALLAVLTDMNIAEICGVQWKHVNLTSEWSITDGERIPPGSIAIRKHVCHGRLDNLARKKRRRTVLIPEPLIPGLIALSKRGKFTGPDDFVLVSRSGGPIRERGIAVRRLKRIGRSLQMPWLTWQVLRRTHVSLSYELGTHFLTDQVAREAPCI